MKKATHYAQLIDGRTRMFLARLDELHPGVLLLVIPLFVVVVGAAAFAVVVIAVALTLAAAAGGVILLARWAISAAADYSHRSRAAATT
ncbi:hypothetical protein [Streptomyces sp. DH12]|uniref:hypothetical protein n=1 Tax=Streptomyces sp. DH12 TaxID=2857010 RepID=UPI001E61A623|nr:hypothetical protein [Streptomyces sp. DH12]